MKAKDNYTGEIIEIDEYSPVTYRTSDGTCGKRLIKGLTFLDAEKDYYTKLEHQFAGMVMQAYISNSHYNPSTDPLKLAKVSSAIAIALVEELKKSKTEQ